MELFRTEVLLRRMVRLRNHAGNLKCEVLELCCSEWFQNSTAFLLIQPPVLELCYSEWLQNRKLVNPFKKNVLELRCSL